MQLVCGWESGDGPGQGPVGKRQWRETMMEKIVFSESHRILGTHTH